jgi:hypothetical protein
MMVEEAVQTPLYPSPGFMPGPQHGSNAGSAGGPSLRGRLELH